MVGLRYDPTTQTFRQDFGGVISPKPAIDGDPTRPMRVHEAPPEAFLRTFTNERWGKLLDATFAEIRRLAQVKGAEYSGDVDRLANFRRNAVRLGVSKELVLAIYMNKHLDAIDTYIRDKNEGRERVRSEPISGRIDDAINYLLLLKAMVEEDSSLWRA